MATSSIGWLGSSPEQCNAAVTSREGELYCNLQVESLEEPFQQGMVVGDSRMYREEGEGGDVFVKS